MRTTAQIITVGDELLLGQVVDTNSAWIGEIAADNGLAVAEILSISDNHAAIVEALARGVERFDVLIVTGGLGPTADDITKAAVADFCGVDLVRDDATFERVKDYMAAREVDFNELNQAQADIPRGFTALPNGVGTAPGLCGEKDGKLIFCLPGVPFEMKALFENEVLPIVRERFELQSVVRRTVLVYGIAESELAVVIGDWEGSLPPYIKLAYLPNPRGIRLRLSAFEVPVGVDAVDEIERCFNVLKPIIKDFYIGYEPTSVEAEVAKLLVARGATLAVAESCTGGAISARCTALVGASRWYRGSITAYDNDIKMELLDVDIELIGRYGAVSEKVVRAMARGACRALGSTYAIATTGIAGPGGGSQLKPVGTVWIAVATPKTIHSFCHNFGEPRGVCIERASTAALAALRSIL